VYFLIDCVDVRFFTMTCQLRTKLSRVVVLCNETSRLNFLLGTCKTNVRRGCPGTTKKRVSGHDHLATCTDTVHVANSWPCVPLVLDPGVTKCTFGRVYSNTRVQLDTCIKIHVSDCLTRVIILVSNSQPRVYDTRGSMFCLFLYFLFKYNY